MKTLAFSTFLPMMPVSSSLVVLLLFYFPFLSRHHGQSHKTTDWPLLDGRGGQKSTLLRSSSAPKIGFRFGLSKPKNKNPFWPTQHVTSKCQSSQKLRRERIIRSFVRSIAFVETAVVWTLENRKKNNHFKQTVRLSLTHTQLCAHVTNSLTLITF